MFNFFRSGFYFLQKNTHGKRRSMLPVFAFSSIRSFNVDWQAKYNFAYGKPLKLLKIRFSTVSTTSHRRERAYAPLTLLSLPKTNIFFRDIYKFVLPFFCCIWRQRFAHKTVKHLVVPTAEYEGRQTTKSIALSNIGINIEDLIYLTNNRETERTRTEYNINYL